jgi:hypothetical protein
VVGLLEDVWFLPKLRESPVLLGRSSNVLLILVATYSVKLLSGSISHQNPGNQFGHAAPIFMIILLFLTAVLQIMCLNRGLRVYDSTLVVPVFYSIYTATGYVL